MVLHLADPVLKPVTEYLTWEILLYLLEISYFDDGHVCSSVTSLKLMN